MTPEQVQQKIEEIQTQVSEMKKKIDKKKNDVYAKINQFEKDIEEAYNSSKPKAWIDKQVNALKEKIKTYTEKITAWVTTKLQELQTWVDKKIEKIEQDLKEWALMKLSTMLS